MIVDLQVVIEQLAEKLNVTPVKARRFLVMRDDYSKRLHLVTVLRSEIPVDALIMRGLGWLRK